MEALGELTQLRIDRGRSDRKARRVALFLPRKLEFKGWNPELTLQNMERISRRSSKNFSGGS